MVLRLDINKRRFLVLGKYVLKEVEWDANNNPNSYKLPHIFRHVFLSFNNLVYKIICDYFSLAYSHFLIHLTSYF